MLRIVIAFDGSPSAREALARAAELYPGAAATVLCVAHRPDAMAEAARSARVALPAGVIARATDELRRQAIDEAEGHAAEGCRRAEAAGLVAQARVTSTDGPVWAAILAVVDELPAVAVACGTQGHGAGVRAVVGSVASGLIAAAAVPVLVVAEEALPASGPILVAFDGSASADRAIAAAGRLFAGGDAVVGHVWRSAIRHTLTGAALLRAPARELREIVGDFEAVRVDAAQELVDRGAALASERGLSARSVLAEDGGSVAFALMDMADELDASAIVVGRRGRGTIAGALLGSVSASLVHASERPVLVIP